MKVQVLIEIQADDTKFNETEVVNWVRDKLDLEPEDQADEGLKIEMVTTPGEKIQYCQQCKKFTPHDTLPETGEVVCVNCGIFPAVIEEEVPDRRIPEGDFQEPPFVVTKGSLVRLFERLGFNKASKWKDKDLLKKAKRLSILTDEECRSTISEPMRTFADQLIRKSPNIIIGDTDIEEMLNILDTPNGEPIFFRMKAKDMTNSHLVLANGYKKNKRGKSTQIVIAGFSCKLKGVAKQHAEDLVKALNMTESTFKNGVLSAVR